MAEPTGSGIIAVCSCRARLLGRTFQISLEPKTQPLAPGGSAVYAVRTSGRAAGISLRLGALPARVSGAFDRPVLRAGETARLTLTALSDAPPWASGAFEITGSSAASLWAASAGLEITPVADSSALSADRRIVVLPAGLKLAVTLGAERTNGPLALSIGRLPPGLTAAFTQTTLEAGGGVVLTLSAERSARRGSFTIDVNGSSAAARVSFPIQVHVVDGGESPQPTGGCTSATAAWEAMIAAAAVALVSRRRRRLQPKPPVVSRNSLPATCRTKDGCVHAEWYGGTGPVCHEEGQRELSNSRLQCDL